MKKKLKKIGASLLAALTTPTAVKAEKSVAIMVIARLAMTLPAYALIINFLLALLGAPSVSP